jgi:uncharacterized protein (TIGR00251 family)
VGPGGGAGLDGGVGFRLAVRVQPGARRTGVGGARGEALVVRVAQPPESGRATEACLRAVAEAFGVPRRAVRLVAGATSRDKTVELDGPYDALADRARQLRAAGAAH